MFETLEVYFKKNVVESRDTTDPNLSVIARVEVPCDVSRESVVGEGSRIR